ncbi:MAG TPA: protein kinase [Burkholderiales bacterium]|jgi:non-specific serine/threonine protein kinase|nr:protein kinase [Burkholderiales bacterium]
MGGENNTELMFGKYRAIKEIGRGATAVVYLAEEVNPARSGDGEDQPAEGFPSLAWGDGPITPRQVAIKVVDFTDDRSKLSRRFRKLFATEAAVTAQFDHPNIAKVYDWKVEDKQAYLVMEYVEGEGLDRFVTMDRLLPMHKVVGIIFKLAMALDYAHRRGIVHRDIKPANALITKDDEVKLMDFGLALNIKKNVNVDSTFINGLGSPSYMSPEQIKGYTLNHQTDLYSLGVMFYQMLAGRLPFRASSTAALVYKIINTEAVAVTQLNPDIPELSDKVIKKALEKDLYTRYRLGADMAKDLSAVRYQILDDKVIAPDDNRWKAVRGLPVLGALDDVDVWELLRLSAWRVLQPATVLMTEGEEGKSFGFILEGELEVEKGERAIAKLTRGDIVGEIAYLDPEGGTRSATVTALNKVTYLEINPSAFAFATEELREEVQRLATNAMVKRLRLATTLAKRASPLAIHPAAVTGPDVEPTSVGAPMSPDKALGWGAFAQVAAAITQAPVHAPAPIVAPPPAPAAAPAQAEALAAAKGAPLTSKSQVLVQPLPAAAAAMIAQMALGNQVMGKAAPDLQPFDLGPETADSPLTPVKDLPADAVLTTEMGAQYGMPGGTSTTEMAANFDAPPPMATSEIAPNFDVHAPSATTDMAANFGTSQMLTTDLAPRFDASQQIMTTDLAPRFDASQQIMTTDLAPRFDASQPGHDSSQQISTTDLAPRFDRSQQLSTSDLAPSFDASQHFATPDQPPRFDSPLLTTEMGANFDAPPPMPSGRAPAAPQRPLRPPVREIVQNSTQALAPEFMSSAPPAYPGAGQPEPAFDMDKTVELSGGFLPGSEAPVPEEQLLGELMPPMDLVDPIPAAPAAAPAPAPAAKPAPAPVAARPAPAPVATPPPAPPVQVIPRPAAPAAAPRPAPGAFKPGMPKPEAPRQGKELQPEDFDKTVILTGGFEALPPDDDSREVDDLFPPIKF